MKQVIIISFIIVALLSGQLVFARLESDNYIIFGDVISTGGGNQSATNYGLNDTIGEAIILSATTTSNNYGIKAGFQELYADQFITLTAGASSVDLGELSSGAVKTASHTLVVDTNAGNGFTLTVNGATLTSGSDTVDAIGGTAAASNAGSEQFGINLVANTSPSVGANPSGTSPIGSAASPYDTADTFAFIANTTDTVASASTDVNATTFTVSYIANIASGTQSGDYTTTLTYSLTGNF